MFRVLGLVLMFATLAGLAACETTKGFVRDARNVGSALASGN